MPVVPISDVKPSPKRGGPSSFDLKRMKATLVKQGQIEPLQINDATHEVFEEDPWGNEILQAAKDLGWDTVLVTYERRYIP